MAQITAQQMNQWADANLTPGMSWQDFIDTWNTLGLNDTDPPDPPAGPQPFSALKAAFVDAIVAEFDGEVPEGWPN